MRRGVIDMVQQLLRSLTSGSGAGSRRQPGAPTGKRKPRRPSPAPTPSGPQRSPSGPQPSPSGPQRSPSRTSASTPTVPGDRIEYTPCLDGDPDPGEVIWTWVPYEEDPTQGKDRPVVIIGRRGSHLLGVPLTSKRHDNEAQVEVGKGPWDREDRISYAKVERLLDIDPADVRREGAVLERARFDAVVAGVQAERGR